LAYVYCYLALRSGLIGALRWPICDRAPDFSPIEDMLILDDGLTDLYRECYDEFTAISPEPSSSLAISKDASRFYCWCCLLAIWLNFLSMLIRPVGLSLWAPSTKPPATKFCWELAYGLSFTRLLILSLESCCLLMSYYAETGMLWRW